jgi:hypothetical protein
VSSIHMRRKVVRTCHITTEYKEQIGESLSWVTRVVTFVMPLNGKLENMLQKILHELKRLSGSKHTYTTI